jgi:hypothetical protein
MFRKKTVASVLATFNKVVDDLDSVTAENLAVVSKNEDKIAALEAESTAARVEAGKAQTIRARIADLLTA